MPSRRLAAAAVLGGFVVLTAAHFLVARGTHGQHVVHVAFGAAYLLPIVAASVWLGPRWAVATGLASAAAYAVHARTSWSGEPMENANQLSLAAVFVFVSVVAAALVESRDRERRLRAVSELRAQRDAALQAIAALSAALRHRDDCTGDHCELVARIVVDLGGLLGLAPDRIEVLRLAGLVHDVGKIGVRDDVLFKPAELNAEERQSVQRHPAIAANLLAPIWGAGDIAELVLSHHECPDGSGYPRGLSGSQLSVEARALRAADVYAALIEERPYKSGLSPSGAARVLREMSGKVDERCVAALEAIAACSSAG